MEEKKLGGFDVFMMLVVGLMFADTITSTSSAGVPSLTWWLILGILYMIPSGAIIGELSSAIPDEGGIYAWIYEGMGPKWAAFTSWLFFACGLFIPVSSFVMCSDILFDLIYPSAPFLVRTLVAVVFIWVMAWVSMMPMAEAKWVNNTAGIIKLCLFLLCGIAGIAYLVAGNPGANPMTVEALTPTLDEGLTYLPVIVYCCTGMELASASAEQTDNPAKTLPRAIVGVAALAVILNIFANWGMLAVLPVGDIDLDFGLLDVFKTAFGSQALYMIAGFAMLFAVFSQCVTWAVGGNRGACESGKSGELPAILGKENEAGQPMGALLISAIAGTVMLLFYAVFAESASGLFFSMLSCGVIGSLLPYVFMVVAYQRMKRDGRLDKNEGFKCPAGMLLSWVVQIIQCVTLFLMIYIPGVGWSDSVVTNVIGFVFMVITGVIAIKVADKQQAKAPTEVASK